MVGTLNTLGSACQHIFRQYSEYKNILHLKHGKISGSLSEKITCIIKKIAHLKWLLRFFQFTVSHEYLKAYIHTSV